MLKLLVCKARYGLSDAGFDAFLSIIADMLPKDNKVPANTYYAKKLISPLTGDKQFHPLASEGHASKGATTTLSRDATNPGVVSSCRSSS